MEHQTLHSCSVCGDGGNDRWTSQYYVMDDMGGNIQMSKLYMNNEKQSGKIFCLLTLLETVIDLLFCNCRWS